MITPLWLAEGGYQQMESMQYSRRRCYIAYGLTRVYSIYPCYSTCTPAHHDSSRVQLFLSFKINSIRELDAQEFPPQTKLPPLPFPSKIISKHHWEKILKNTPWKSTSPFLSVSRISMTLRTSGFCCSSGMLRNSSAERDPFWFKSSRLKLLLSLRISSASTVQREKL